MSVLVTEAMSEKLSMSYSRAEKALLARYGVACALIGAVFPILAYAITAHHARLSFADTFLSHIDPLLYLNDLGPIILGGIGLWSGVREIKLQRARNDETIQRLELAELIGEYGSWTFDLETREVTWSKGLFALLELDQARHLPSAELFMSFYQADELARSQAVVKHLVSGALSTFDEQFTLSLKSGRLKHIRSKGALSSNGKIGRGHRTIVGTTRDITSLVEARELARIADDAVSRIEGVKATIVTCKHEINTPLAVAVASLELLENRLGEQSEIEAASSSLTRIAKLLKVLEVSANSEGELITASRKRDEQVKNRLPRI